jgi:hypothetical protein
MDSKGHSPQDRQEAFARDGDAALRLVPVDSNDSNDSLNETTHPRSAFQRQNDVSSIEQVYKAMSEGGTQQVAHKAASDSDDTIEARKEMSLQVGPHSDETYAGTSTGEHQVKQPSRQAPQRPAIPGAFPDSYISTVGEEKDDPIQERLSESPVHVSHTDAVGSNPPALMVDTSSQEAASPTPSRSPSPDLVDMDERLRKKSSENSIRTSTSTSTWNDANLRTYFDDDTDIKELLLVVYDKSGVVPAGPDHPITGNLFKEENARLAEISNVSHITGACAWSQRDLLTLIIAFGLHAGRLVSKEDEDYACKIEHIQRLGYGHGYDRRHLTTTAKGLAHCY